MKHAPIDPETILEDIPDPDKIGFARLHAWIQERTQALRNTDFTKSVTDTLTPVTLAPLPDYVMGPVENKNWRRFFLAALFADWSYYTRPEDKIDYARLRYIMTSAYPYFRVWFCRLPDGQMTPVGYTAWYPIPSFVFEGMRKGQASFDDRGIFMPHRWIQYPDIRHVYLLNISIIEALGKTPCGYRLTRAIKRDLDKMPKAKIMTTTVTGQGHKICRLWHFEEAQTCVIGGEKEYLMIRPPIQDKS